ncbi:MAG: putative bifunctional diguanylate cyclase/phosphodiesterase [Candidatus Limnocylindrales bacterium]
MNDLQRERRRTRSGGTLWWWERFRRGILRGPIGSAAGRVWSFTLLLATLALIGYVADARHMSAYVSPVSVPWPVLAVAFLAAETKVIVVHFRRETHSFSLSEVPAVIGLFFVTPDEYMLAVLTGSALALLVTARQSAVKVAFNLANFAFIATVTLAVFHRMATPSGVPAPIDWVAAFSAMLTGCVIGALTIATAISLSGGAPQFQKLPEMLKFGSVVALANTSLALLAVSVMWTNAAAVWLLIIPLVTIFLAYRAYLAEREKHERLELLYESSRIMQHAVALDSALVALLDHARHMFRAEIAEVILYPRDATGDSLRTTSTHDAAPQTMVPVRLDPEDVIHARIAAERHAFFTSASAERAVRGRHVRQAMVSPLIGESGMIGSMTVANRLTEGTSFEASDLRLLETLANQAAIALENGQLEQSLAELSRLKEELRHQAYHDPLTGLANRSMFSERVEAHLAVPETGHDTTVLFLDLDDFKIVNDTLGHAAGDRLLAAVAERIRGCVRADDLAARLGGDEFAVLLVDESGMDRAMAVAQRIIDALQLPFLIAGQDISVGGSIGIAVAHGMGESAGEMLRNADVAMYTAKAGGKGRAAVFDPTMHAAIVARHALSAELSKSLSRGELAVVYQPIVRLATMQTIGVEALVRWRHPTRGLVLPDEFIPLAEESGLILPLSRWVLSEACLQTASWERRLALPDGFFVSVNLSPLQVQQPEFTAEVESIMAATTLAPSRLVLELTETAMFQDTEATILKFEALRARGVRVALDDFGTGYSSLGYLRRFPIDIIKIARDFVVPSDHDDSEWAFAHAIVALGQTLGLRIVAEGIEETAQADRLRQLGCDYGQGFHFARPVDAAGLSAHLLATMSPRTVPIPSSRMARIAKALT